MSWHMPPPNGSCLLSLQARLGGWEQPPGAFVEGPQQVSFQGSWLFPYRQLKEPVFALGRGGGRWGMSKVRQLRYVWLGAKGSNVSLPETE